MVWETTLQGKTWTQSPSGKGGRTQPVKKGVFVIDHRPTGRFITGSSSDVSKEVDKQLKLLANGKHPNKLLQGQWVKEPIFLITEIPVESEKAIKKTLKEIEETNTTPYCYLK